MYGRKQKYTCVNIISLILILFLSFYLYICIYTRRYVGNDFEKFVDKRPRLIFMYVKRCRWCNDLIRKMRNIRLGKYVNISKSVVKPGSKNYIHYQKDPTVILVKPDDTVITYFGENDIDNMKTFLNENGVLKNDDARLYVKDEPSPSPNILYIVYTSVYEKHGIALCDFEKFAIHFRKDIDTSILDVEIIDIDHPIAIKFEVKDDDSFPSILYKQSGESVKIPKYEDTIEFLKKHLPAKTFLQSKKVIEEEAN